MMSQDNFVVFHCFPSIQQLAQSKQIIVMFDQSTKLCDVKYKIVFLGPSSVGKSAIIQRFTQQTFDHHRAETVGIDFIMKNVVYQGLVYRLQLWDTAGQEKFRSLIPTYIRDAHCAVFVFDITRKDTFQNVDVWIELFKNFRNDQAVTVLVGNKLDSNAERQVSEEEAQAKADIYSMSYCETSAKINSGVDQLFHSLIGNIRVQRGQKNEEGPQSGTTLASSQAEINKTRLVKIRKEKKQWACCYI